MRALNRIWLRGRGGAAAQDEKIRKKEARSGASPSDRDESGASLTVGAHPIVRLLKVGQRAANFLRMSDAVRPDRNSSRGRE